ncbi:acyl carrier protein [Roseiconus lacunae]|uniref:Acyl carrier protein n=1 Tax=Roseiconus lacunae TaxID=2605694 RepID=A0ABT7PDJ2_9BACT|nr:acyl carrier protein [Roseiconus lacunae]MCD0459855.1 acyl carrier protein [Roseiconus lacunae]MDM4014553.1 acyl carrier protein [Roseiconus lacunae]WRQ49866.1 acyl carrier protein [Stieleria sp. HD01]
MKIRETILTAMREVAHESEKSLAEPITDDSALLQFGLDSMDFAIVVARLEREFGDDPFASLEDAVYPTTFSQFLAIYEDHFLK